MLQALRHQYVHNMYTQHVYHVYTVYKTCIYCGYTQFYTVYNVSLHVCLQMYTACIHNVLSGILHAVYIVRLVQYTWICAVYAVHTVCVCPVY